MSTDDIQRAINEMAHHVLKTSKPRLWFDQQIWYCGRDGCAFMDTYRGKTPGQAYQHWREQGPIWYLANSR